MMELRKGEVEFNIENISLELRRPRTFSQIKILEIHENIEDFHPCIIQNKIISFLHHNLYLLYRKKNKKLLKNKEK